MVDVGPLLEQGPPGHSADRTRFGNPTTNARILNAVLRRQLVVTDLSETLANRIARIYLAAGRDARSRMLAALASGASPTGFSQVLRAAQLQSFIEVIRPIAEQLRGQVAQEFQEFLGELWQAETQTGAAIFTR